jgi:hypothetical protein
MITRFAPLASLLALVGLGALATRGDAAEVYALLANGQGIVGTVPAGDAIRLQFPLSRGAKPTLSLTLTGSPLTVSFREFHLYGPDGQEVAFDPGAQFFTIKPHTAAGGGRDGLVFKGWPAEQSGFHQLVITTNATRSLRATGKLTIARTTRFPFQGDETSPPEVNPLRIAMQGDPATGIFERVTISVRRLSGTAPYVAATRSPSGATIYVSQTKTKRGSTTRPLNTLEFGDYLFTIGYQTTVVPPTQPVGRWKGVVTVKPFRGGYPATLSLRNSPGIPLSVLDVDRSLSPPFGGTHVGVATDSTSVLVTSEGGGNLYGELVDQDLTPPFTPAVVTMAGAADLPTGETVAGHRLTYMGGAYFATVSTATGQSLLLARFNTQLQRTNFLTVVGGSADPTADGFLAGDGVRVSVGIFHAATAGHTMHLYDAANLGNPATISIGGALFPQAQGCGAAWRGTDAVFELWSPDTLDYRGPSKLHRVLYSSAWEPVTPDARWSFTDPSPTETMPTAVSVDFQSGITIVHYVAADNPPNGPLGSGNVHRRLFDATGVEIPGSHQILPRIACNRPSSALIGNRLFLAYDTPSGPVVERYPLLRTPK